MATDYRIDPTTLDYVDDGAGNWIEDDNSATPMLIQLESERDRWWGDPTSGSDNHKLLAAGQGDGSPTTANQLLDSTKRAATALVQAGLISDLAVVLPDVDDDPNVQALGDAEIDLYWTDRATNAPADLNYSPIGGAPEVTT